MRIFNLYMHTLLYCSNRLLHKTENFLKFTLNIFIEIFIFGNVKESLIFIFKKIPFYFAIGNMTCREIFKEIGYCFDHYESHFRYICL